MKILIVGMGRSIHTVRWINQLKDTGWEIHLFPSFDNGATHPLLQYGTVHHSAYAASENQGVGPIFKGIRLSSRLAKLLRSLKKRIFPKYRKQQLAQLIDEIKPDVVHSLGIDTGSLLALEAKAYQSFIPAWLVTNWGSDLYFFGRKLGYREKMLRVLKEAKHFSCECERDDVLARTEYEFTGTVYPYIQCGGGWNLQRYEAERNQVNPSKRRIIAIKGYQHLTGRAAVALQALSACKDFLEGYEVVVFGADPEKEVSVLVEDFRRVTGCNTRIVPHTSDYEAMMRLQAQARIFIGLSISDGVSNSFLEAMIMGAFPIQSYSSSPEEWIQDGVSGFAVPPEDPEAIEQAIRKALEDDHLVDKAAELNWKTAQQRLDAETVRNQAIAMYEAVAASSQS